MVTILLLAPSFVLISFVSSAVIGMKRFRSIRPFFIILVAPGIALHEASHYLLCRLAGVRVEKLHLLEVDKRWNARGYVSTEPIQNSFLKPFLIAVAPSFINTISACLLIFVFPCFTITWTRLLICWLAASLVLGCRPSSHDLATAFKSLVKYPRKSLGELGYLVIGIIFGLVLLRISPTIIGVDLPPLLAATFSLLAMILAYVIIRQN